MPLLLVEHLSLTLQSQRILHHVNLAIKRGEVVGLIGPNGSGKTTFFNVLSGFLRPTVGRIHFKDADITALSPSKRAAIGMGRVFQNFGIFREMTLEENVLVALEALPRVQRTTLGNLREKARETLRMIHLSDHAKRKASSLSGGQMRLLEIARTFACEKELFLLDEPTAGVAPKMVSQVADLILNLKRSGKTILLIEHDLPFLQRICDRVMVMDVGEIVLEGTPSEIQHHPKLKEMYFGVEVRS